MITEFTIRRIHAEIVEGCAKIALNEKVDPEPGDEGDRAYNTACDHIVDAIRTKARALRSIYVFATRSNP